MLVSLLDVRDLLALRLVSTKTRTWVDDVMSKFKGKVFTLLFNDIRTLDELMGEEIDRIPYFRGLNVGGISFFTRPLIPSFLRIYGPQIHTVSHHNYDDDFVSEDVDFYRSLPNLTQLSTRWLGENKVEDMKMPALERLKLFTVPSTWNERSPGTDFEFLVNFPNLMQLWLTIIDLSEYFEILSALGPYFAIRNGWEERLSRKPLTILFDTPGAAADYNYQLNEETEEGVARLLEELAVADGRILIENMPVLLLDEAVRLFHHQRGGKLLKSFGKCIRSLIGFSSSLSKMELPNMRRLEVG
jgi:hypothetical protein